MKRNKIFLNLDFDIRRGTQGTPLMTTAVRFQIAAHNQGVSPCQPSLQDSSKMVSSPKREEGGGLSFHYTLH